MHPNRNPAERPPMAPEALAQRHRGRLTAALVPVVLLAGLGLAALQAPAQPAPLQLAALALLAAGCAAALWLGSGPSPLAGAYALLGAALTLGPLGGGGLGALATLPLALLLAGVLLPPGQSWLGLGLVGALGALALVGPGQAPPVAPATALVTLAACAAGGIIIGRLGQAAMLGAARHGAQAAAEAAALRADAAALEALSAQQARNLDALRAELAAATGAPPQPSAGEALSYLNHDLRSPLNVVLNYTRFLGLARYGTLTERQQELQQAILASAQQLLGLINDVVDLARLEHGRLALAIEPVALTPILERAITFTADRLGARPVALTLAAPPQLPPVLADPARVAQMLQGLLDSAAARTAEGSITLRAARVADTLLIAIEVDELAPATGHEAAPHEPGPARRPDLQLSLARGLAELQGGRLWTTDGGAGVRFSLPLAGAEASPGPAAGPLGPEGPAHPRPTLSVAGASLDEPPPPAATLDALLHLARSGDLGGLSQALAPLEAEHPRLVGRLRALSRDFEERAIRRLLEQAAERARAGDG